MKRAFLLILTVLGFAGCSQNDYQAVFTEMGIAKEVHGDVKTLHSETTQLRVSSSFYHNASERISVSDYSFNESGQVTRLSTQDGALTLDVSYDGTDLPQSVRFSFSDGSEYEMQAVYTPDSVTFNGIRPDGTPITEIFRIDTEGNLIHRSRLESSVVRMQIDFEYQGNILLSRTMRVLLDNGSYYVPETRGEILAEDQVVYSVGATNSTAGVITELEPTYKVAFNSEGMPIRRSRISSISPEAVSAFTEYEYDEEGRLLQEREFNLPYDRQDDPQLVSGKDFEYRFDEWGNILERDVYYIYYIPDEPERVLIEMTRVDITYW